MKFEETLLPEDVDIIKLRDMLRKYNRQNFETSEQTEFAIYIKDDNENITGGVSGEILGNQMKIEYLVIHESLRRQGVGKELLQKAKNLAIKKIVSIYFFILLAFKVKISIPNMVLKKFM